MRFCRAAMDMPCLGLEGGLAVMDVGDRSLIRRLGHLTYTHWTHYQITLLMRVSLPISLERLLIGESLRPIFRFYPFGLSGTRINRCPTLL